MQVQTFILDIGKRITLTERKTEYLAFKGTKRFLGINLWRDELRAAAGKFGGNLVVLTIFIGIGFAYIGKKQYLCSNPKWRDNNYYVKYQ